MSRFLFFGVVAAIGAAFAYLFDPKLGRSRRAKAMDQATARLRDASETVKSKVEYQKGVAKGVIHDITQPIHSDEIMTITFFCRRFEVKPSGTHPTRSR